MNESFCLISCKTRLTGLNQKWQSQMLHEKKLKYKLILSRDFDDQRIQKLDWTKGTTGYTQPKKNNLRSYFPLTIISVQKNPRYWWIPSTNTDDQRILKSDLLRSFWAITREPYLSLTYGFHRIIKHINLMKYFVSNYGD